MNPELAERIEALREDFREVSGTSFAHFYCPILFRDEPAQLCRGHVENAAFPGSDRSWVVQRADLDGFYGSAFESDFVVLALRGSYSLIQAVADPALRRKLRPVIRVDGQNVPHYQPRGEIPAGHTPILMGEADAPVPLVLKISEDEVLAAKDQNWEIAIERDLRLPALVAALKSAHLTLFYLLGYRYGLSAAGNYMGGILGKFFQENYGRSKQDVAAAGKEYFGEYHNIARPILDPPESLVGTVSSRKMYLLKTPAWPWAMMVFVRAGKHVNAVLVPVFENHHAVARYLRFVREPDPTIYAHLTVLERNEWKVSPEPQRFEWPASRFHDGIGRHS